MLKRALPETGWPADALYEAARFLGIDAVRAEIRRSVTRTIGVPARASSTCRARARRPACTARPRPPTRLATQRSMYLALNQAELRTLTCKE